MGKYEELLTRLRTVNDIQQSVSVLSWDQNTVMPKGGAEARARQMSTLSRLSHEMFTDEATGKLLEQAENEIDDIYESDEVSMLRVVKDDYEHLTKVPAQFVADYTRETSIGLEVWSKARAENDFAQFQPTLERL
jgi:carboxypeptidase Taq